MSAVTAQSVPIQSLPTSTLMDEYRDLLLAIGAERVDVEQVAGAHLTTKARRAVLLEEEILRRMAW